ncbi:hypothetical protein SO802_019305 [Lithocarpus litseifolius]|uniref:NAC domain-containing protein n=1 Tax=Lithocarpus litseifolius TaxID=425828 RepID=A0AAW2CNA6_9ROSI
MESKQDKPSIMASGVTNQVIPNVITQSLQALNTPRSNTSSCSSPSVADHSDNEEEEPDQEEQKDDENQSSKEVDSVALHRILNDLMKQFGEEQEKKYHSFEHKDPPIGYRFEPTDYDLIMRYLIRKVLKKRLPWNQIVDVDLYKHNPESLAEANKKYDGKEEWYFFTPRKLKYKKRTCPYREAGDGYWKPSRADIKIESKGTIVGYKKVLVFHRGKAPNGVKTNWIMHEYRLNHPPVTRRDENDMELDEWVLCRIYNNIKTNTQDKSCSLVKGKGKKDETCSTSLHHGDRNARNQPMPKVDPTTVIVEDYMNQSHQNVPAFSHMASRFPDQFHPVASDYGTPQIIEPIPGMHNFQNESSGYANNMVSLPNELQTVVGKYETPPAMIKPIPGMPYFHNELSGFANNKVHFPNESKAVVGNYGIPPATVKPIPGMPYFRNESSGSANNMFRFPNESQAVVGNYGTPPAMVKPIPGMPSFRNESSGSANNMVGFTNDLQAVVGKYKTPPAMVKPIPGMPSFRNESSGSANNMVHFPNESQAVVGNYGTPPQMIGPILGMPSFPNESSGYVHSKFSANELGQFQKDFDTTNVELQLNFCSNNYPAPMMQMDDIVPNKRQKLSDDDKPCE